MKPQLKNVTTSDIANSLYYLHLNTEDDARLIEEEQHLRSDNESISSMQKPVPRKPLADSARSSLDINRQSAPPLARLESNTALSTKRKPVPTAETTAKSFEPNQGKSPLSRRPLGPRPQLETSGSVSRKPVPGYGNSPISDGLLTASRTASPSRPDAHVERNSFLNPSPHDEAVTSKNVPAFTITIIRRDPSSESQWNVGTISGRPVVEGGERPTIAQQQSKRPYFEMSVHLETPGYAPFRHSYMASKMEAMNIKRASTQNPKGATSDGGKHIPANYGFDREIRMEGSDFWARASFQHKRARSDMSVKQGITRGRSFSGSEGVGTSESQHGTLQADSSSQSKGYMFLSPWGGRCKFSTSSSGRSLRCNHTLPEPVSAKDSVEDSSPPAQASVAVSEIRFNLPSAAIFNTVAETLTKLERDHPRFSIGHIRSKLASHKSPTSSHPPRHPSDEDGPPLPPRPHRTSFNTSSDDDMQRHARGSQHPSSMDTPATEDDLRFDLSLGQEKAGGGNRGKRAKLGKLIIHDEGFKFLDLLIASNMAVWWSVWEPDF